MQMFFLPRTWRSEARRTVPFVVQRTRPLLIERQLGVAPIVRTARLTNAGRTGGLPVVGGSGPPVGARKFSGMPALLALTVFIELGSATGARSPTAPRSTVQPFAAA